MKLRRIKYLEHLSVVQKKKIDKPQVIDFTVYGSGNLLKRIIARFFFVFLIYIEPRD